MPEPFRCPGADRLRELLAGRATDEVAAHVEECPHCQAALDDLAGGASFPDLAAALAGGEAPPDPALRHVMERAKRSAGAEPTRGEDPPGADNLSFLAPSDKPGHLGRLGHYEILGVVGRGGMGVVLKGFDEALHRVVAIKVVASPLAMNGLSRQRFQREARAAAAVMHEHVVAIHGVEEADGLPYLVMQYVAGVSLQERIDRTGPLQLNEVLRIGMQAAAGLAAAHAQGLVHRDVKPANILLENGVERVKITDFGLARAVDDAGMTQSGVIVGTAEYMAPEQARGEAVDHRADLFSLGSVLYAMCTGRPPFRAAGTLAVLKRVSEDTPRPIRAINPDVPDWLCAIIDKLLAKDPAGRFQSAKEVAELLGQHLAHLQQPQQVPMPPRVASPRRKLRISREMRAIRAMSALVGLLGLLIWVSLIDDWLDLCTWPRLVGVVRDRGFIEAVVEPGDGAESLTDVKLVVHEGGEKFTEVRAGGWTYLRAGVPYELTAEGTSNRKVIDLEVMPPEVVLRPGQRQVVRISPRRKPAEALARPEAPAVQSPPFLVRFEGDKELYFHTLAEAVASAARNGVAVEIRGDGPYATAPVTVEKGKALTIRAAAGSRPVLRLVPGDKKPGPLIETDSPLVLEGLTLQQREQDGPLTADSQRASLVFSYGGPVHVANCRFLAGKYWRGVTVHKATCEARNCEFLGADLHAAVDWNCPPAGELAVENCAVLAKFHGLVVHQAQPFDRDVAVRVARCTLLADMALNYWCWAPERDLLARLAAGSARPLRLEAVENVFDPYWSVLEFRQVDQKRPMDLKEAETELPHLLAWQGRCNLYPASNRFLFINTVNKGAVAKPTEPAPGVWHLAQWAHLWGNETDPQEGRIAYASGNLAARARPDPAALTPEDFRLTDDSAGHAAGSGGRDLGADVTLLGPGKAYVRWKETPEYLRWQEATRPGNK